MIVHSHESITTLENLLSWVDLSKSSFYYKSSDGKRGAKPSVCTFRQDGTRVDDTLVIEEIKGILSQDTSGKRQFVKHRKIEATRPMEYLCLDIKYVWVAGESRNYFLLTVLDVFTRVAIEQIFQKSIRKMDVINIFRRINSAFGIKGVTVRNDNGSQFIANDVKQFLRTAEANQEFTHIATPEENAYIEAFHSIVQREVIDRFEFQGFYEAKLTLQAHRDWYNNRRRHAALGTVPVKKWNCYFGGLLPFDTIYNLKKETISQYLTNHQTNEYICSSTPIYDTGIAQPF